jgi:acetyltransferase-like isoleucine patch superfamily enzyme
MRRQFASSGARVAASARIYGWRGIKLGTKTTIYSQATLACSCLDFHDAPDMHPAGSISLGKRCTVLNGALLATYGGEIIIGDDVSFNPGVIIYGHGGVRIGNGTRIAARTLIIPANHTFLSPDIPIMCQGLTCRGISVGRDVWMGAHVVVLDGVTIGDGCVVGAGAVITKSLPPFSIAVGVPAKIIGKRGQLSEPQIRMDADGEISTVVSENPKNDS